MMELSDAVVDEFRREVDFLRTCRHPCIVLFFGAGTAADDSPFLVSELCARGSLSLMLWNSPEIALAQKCSFMHDIARGMAHIHSMGRIHRDLKVRWFSLALAGTFVYGLGWRGCPPQESQPLEPVAWCPVCDTWLFLLCALPYCHTITYATVFNGDGRGIHAHPLLW